MKKALCIILFFSILCAQENEPISETQAMLQEAVQAAQSELPSTTEDAYLDNLTPQQRFEQNPKHNVHEYNYKQQVIVGGVVMLCVALAMIANNNYNPKPGVR
ncbi:MAG: hypothetical protein LBC85_06670 [Fibromonadaceae bacterium]|jgi:hypothetical protein|nr:hypothetical protein [Fibromonadaceae bacterium]